jgi:hypothetical protein
VVGARPLAAGIAGWIAGALASVAVGLLALSSVGADLTGSGDLPFTVDPSQIDAGAEAPVTTEPSVSAGPGRTVNATSPTHPSTGPPGRQRRLDSAGGYVVARCRSGQVYLVYWSPATGFRADDVERGPARQARVTFKGAGLEVKMKVDCAGGGDPRADIEQEAEDSDHS